MVRGGSELYSIQERDPQGIPRILHVTNQCHLPGEMTIARFHYCVGGFAIISADHHSPAVSE
jgi:hypothetical protein